MLPRAKLLRLSAAFLLPLSVLSLAHGHGHGNEGSNLGPAVEGGVIETTTSNVTNPSLSMAQTYFHLQESQGWIYAHILIMVLSWFFILPVAVMFTVASSHKRFYAQASFQISNALGLILGIIYDGRTPDLYRNNSHHKLGWAVTWIYLISNIIGIFNHYAERRKAQDGSSAERQYFMPISAEALAQRGFLDEEDPDKPRPNRYSYDSGQGTERASSSLRSNSLSPSEEQAQPDFTRRVTFAASVDENESLKIYKATRIGRIDTFLSDRLPVVSNGVLRLSNIFEELLTRTILPLGFVAIATGVVTYSGIFTGSSVFNGLAHFIKGGIFFWYGLLTLGRYVGAFADFGWAWNVKPSAELVGPHKARIPSAEFVESLVIFTYGTSNVFLEHLAAWGSAWTAMDLEHVSISIMFFGGGLCGMLVESSKIRNLLNTTVVSFKQRQNSMAQSSEEMRPPKQYRFSSNPIPALIILLLGLMMSSHHQASMVSSMVHKQWGMLLVGFAFSRAVTYILLFISPPTSIYPSRPPSELISSFCLISGGIIFMASNRDTVNSMTTYDLDAMFIFTVTMGFTAFLMAWTMLVIALKGWASRGQNISDSYKA